MRGAAAAVEKPETPLSPPIVSSGGVSGAEEIAPEVFRHEENASAAVSIKAITAFFICFLSAREKARLIIFAGYSIIKNDGRVNTNDLC